MNTNPIISVLTPTFNRATLLPRLYNSLCKQSAYFFEWIIIDDGSNDETNKIVSSFSTRLFSIKYRYQQNSGKHVAINNGLKLCLGEYTFIVDSDDWLVPDAIETIISERNKFASIKDICGFSFLRKFSNGSINIESGHTDEYISSYNAVRIYENRNGDMAEVYKTSILLQYPFPIYENEKFLGEDIIWVEIGKKYKLVFVNKAIYVSDYLSDGLTQNRRRNNILNPFGSMNRALQILTVKQKLLPRIKTSIQYLVYGKFCGLKYTTLAKHFPRGKLTLFLLNIPSLIIYHIWRKKHEQHASK